MKMTVVMGDYHLVLNGGFGPTTYETNKALKQARQRHRPNRRLEVFRDEFVQPKLKFKPKLVEAMEPNALLIAHNYLPAEATSFIADCAIAEVITQSYGPFTAYGMDLIEAKFQALIDFPASSFDIIEGFVLYPDTRLPKVHAVVEGPENMVEIDRHRPSELREEHVAGRRIVLKDDWPIGLYVFDHRLYVPADWKLKNTGLEATMETGELVLPEG